MADIEFRNTNRRSFAGCSIVLFSITFLIAFIYIILNLNDFIESHPFEFFLIILMGAFMVFFWFSKLSGGSELNSDLAVNDLSIIVNGEHRFPRNVLQLDEYVSDNYQCFHLYTKDKDFTLYTNEKDDLIQHLLKSDIQKESFEIDEYDFDHNSATVVIKARSGRVLRFNLDNGTFYLFQESNRDEEEMLFKPEYFIQTPGFKQK